VSKVEKRTIIVCRLVSTPEAYEGKTNRDVEKDIVDEMPIVPYATRIDKVLVLDVEGSNSA